MGQFVRGSLLVALAVVTAGLPVGCGKPSPDKLMAEAEAAVQRADYRTAAIQLQSLLQQEPANVPALILLGDVAMAGKNPLLAERSYRKARDLGADESRYWEHWIESLLAIGSFDDVLAEARKRRPVSPADQARQHFLVGRANFGLGQNEAAEVELRASLGLVPGSPETHIMLARVYSASGRPDEAQGEIQAALREAPEFAEALTLQGHLQVVAGDYGAAGPVLEHALLVARRDGNKLLEAEVLGNQAEVALVTGRIDDAAALAAALTAIVGNDPAARYLRARIALERRDLPLARTELQEILAVKKDFAPAQRLLGALYTLENRFDLAEMYLRPAVAANPDDFFARRLLAAVYLARSKPADALPLLGNPDTLGTSSNEALLAMLGQASLQLGDVGKAVQYFREGAAKFPGDPLFELGLGLTLLAEGRTDEAKQVLRQVRGEQAEATRSAFLIVAHMQKGETAEAVADAKLLVEKAPDQAWSHNLLGAVLMATGKFGDAKSSFQKAVRIDPQDLSALANLARAEQLAGSPDDAAAAWRAILAKDSSNADAAFWLARLELDRGNIDAAMGVLGPFEKTSSRARLLVGTVLLDRGAYGRVRAIGQQVLQVEPKNAEAYNLIGLADLAQGSYQPAAVSFRKAIELRADAPIYHANLSRALLAAGDDKAAGLELEAAKKLAPDAVQIRTLEFLTMLRSGNTSGARVMLERLAPADGAQPALRKSLEGELLMAERRYGEAAQSFAAAYGARPSLDLAIKSYRSRRSAGAGKATEFLDEWVRRNPEDARALRAAGDACFADNDGTRAAQYYDKLLTLVPDETAVLNNLAWLYQEKGDVRAVRLGNRAAALAPADPAVLDTAGWANLRLGDQKTGLELIRRAATMVPEDRDIQYHLAVALVKTGQTAEGKQVLIRLLAADNAFASREAAERMLREM